MRKIYCSECGVFKPTPLEDVERGLIPRRIYGQAINELICDACGKVIYKGVKIVAESVPRNMGEWESEYLVKV